MRHPRIALVLILLMLLAQGLPGGVLARPTGQSNLSVDTQQEQFPTQNQEKNNDPFYAERKNKLNKLRQEALKKDTEKLLELATELKLYVDKSNEHTLSLDVIRKAEQIEKLAHSVKEKMKGF